MVEFERLYWMGIDKLEKQGWSKVIEYWINNGATKEDLDNYFLIYKKYEQVAKGINAKS